MLGSGIFEPSPLASQETYCLECFRVIEGLCVCVCVCVSHSVTSDSLQPYGLAPHQAPRPWNFPGKSTGGGSHSLLQRIFQTQAWNPGLLHCRQALYHLNHQRSPEIPGGGTKNTIYQCGHNSYSETAMCQTSAISPS